MPGLVGFENPGEKILLHLLGEGVLSCSCAAELTPLIFFTFLRDVKLLTKVTGILLNTFGGLAYSGVFLVFDPKARACMIKDLVLDSLLFDMIRSVDLERRARCSRSEGC